MPASVLLIETSQQCCSVAVNSDKVHSEDIFEPRSHARDVLGMVERVLQEAQIRLPQLSAIAFGRGPGSFTGVRIAASVTQGLAYGADLPVIGVSSLALQAQSCVARLALRDAVVVTAVDARMEEIYAGIYRVSEGLVTPIREDAIYTVEQLTQELSLLDVSIPTYMTGSAHSLLPDFAGFTVSDSLALAKDGIDLVMSELQKSRTEPAQLALPQYLRGSSAWKKSKPI